MQCRLQVLTECFLPIQRGVTSQAVIETPGPCATGDTQQHLLQVCHRLTEKTDGLKVGKGCFFLGENCLTLTACKLKLYLGDYVLVYKGVHSFAIHLFLLGGTFIVEGVFTVRFAFMLNCLARIFRRVFAIPRGLRGDWGLARFGLLDLLKLPLLLLKCLL